MGNNVNPSGSVANEEETFVDMEKKSKNLLKKYQDTLDELDDDLENMKMELLKIKNEMNVSDLEELRENLKKQFKLDRKIDDGEETIEAMKEIREKHAPKFDDLVGFEKYDAIMSMVQDESISHVLEKILEEDLDIEPSEKEKKLEEELFTEEEMEEWVEKEIKRIQK